MKKELINTIEQEMLGYLNNEQLAKLHEVLEHSLIEAEDANKDIQETN